MPLLLDTHTLLWFYSGDSQLPDHIKQEIENTNNQCFLSIASVWEITIKLGTGKLELDNSLNELFQFITRNQIEILPIEFNHLLRLEQLLHFHKDPFDRIIIAQSLEENLPIYTKDSFFQDYGVTVRW